MLVVPEFESAALGRVSVAPATFASLIVRIGVLPAVGIRAQHRAFGMVGFGNGFFALLDLSGEGRLSRRLGGLGSSLRGVNLGRALRCGQVSEL